MSLICLQVLSWKLFYPACMITLSGRRAGDYFHPPSQTTRFTNLVPVIRLIVDCVSDVPQLLLGHPEVMPQLVHDRLADLGLDIAVGA